MKTLTIIGGVNGAGKSSLTGVLKSERKDLGLLLDVDKLAKDKGISDIAAGRTALNNIQQNIAAGISFTWETTLSGNKPLSVIKTAMAEGFFIRLFYVGLDTSDESLYRIKDRVRKGGHNIPTEDVLRRFDTRFHSLEKLLPYCNEAFFYDNSDSFELIATYQNGAFGLTTTRQVEWFGDFLKTQTN